MCNCECCGHTKMVSALKTLVSGHPRDTKKVYVTEAGRLRELKNTELRKMGSCEGGHK